MVSLGVSDYYSLLEPRIQELLDALGEFIQNVICLLKEGTDHFWTTSRACSNKFSTSSSSDDKSTASSSFAREDEGLSCVGFDCEPAAGSMTDCGSGKR